MCLVNCEEPKVVGLLGFLSPLITKEPPLPPPSPLLLILSKGAQIKLLLVEVLQMHTSTLVKVSPPTQSHQ
jgi:hypothetical protein